MTESVVYTSTCSPATLLPSPRPSVALFFFFALSPSVCWRSPCANLGILSARRNHSYANRSTKHFFYTRRNAPGVCRHTHPEAPGSTHSRFRTHEEAHCRFPVTTLPTLTFHSPYHHLVYPCRNHDPSLRTRRRSTTTRARHENTRLALAFKRFNVT